MKIGFVGAGNMAGAMARGWAAAHGEPGAPATLLFTDSGSGRAEKLAEELGGEAVGSNKDLADQADLLVLGMKPAGLADVAKEVAPSGTPVISMLGATSLEELHRAFPDSAVARTMPNLGVELGQGVISLAIADDADQGFRDQVLTLLNLLGTVIEVEDELMDPATAVMGCTPGYLALVAEVLTEAGVREGLSAEDASLMVARSMAATGALLDRRDAAALREAVASPGGSTEAGLEALERRLLREAFDDAVEASLARMRG
jgi:pyrroline-5-carboxylate reductase